MMKQQAKRQQAEEMVQTERQVKQDLEGGCGVPPKYSWLTFKAIEAKGLPTKDSHWVDNYCAVHSFSHSLDQHIEKGDGLIMVGAGGQLKTSMAAALVRQNYDAGRTSYFVEMINLVDTLRTLMNVNKTELVEFDRKLRTVSLLVLDDMGCESRNKDWVLDKVEAIVAYRYSHNKSTIITSNLSVQEMAGMYSMRVMDRLREAAEVLVFKGQSFRKSLTVSDIVNRATVMPGDEPVEQKILIA